MSRESVYPTHKATPEGRAETLARKQARSDKYRPTGARRNMGE